jgi:hypothetical protein
MGDFFNVGKSSTTYGTRKPLCENHQPFYYGIPAMRERPSSTGSLLTSDPYEQRCVVISDNRGEYINVNIIMLTEYIQ